MFVLDLKPSTLSVALSLVVLTSCATTKQEPDAWLADKELVVQSLQDVHVGNAKLLEKINKLDQRILRLENNNAASATKIAMLEAEVQRKQAVVARKPQSNTSNNSTSTLTQRLDVMSANLAPLSPAIIAKPTVSPAVAAQNIADEKNAYTAAYLALKSGRYDEASAGFVKVIKGHPKGEYTDQAYYWLGESLVALLRNKEALESFSVVANQYPKSTKHSAALLKIANVYKSMNDLVKAKAALERVVREYPDSRTAERARAELKTIQLNDGEEQ